MVYKWIYTLGQRFRNPSLNTCFRFLKDSESWDIEKLQSYQLKKLKELLRFAYDHSEFYHTKMTIEGIHPDDIRNLEDLKKLPVLTKEELVVENEKIHTSYSFKKKFLASTSGSSGNSLAFYRDEWADSFNRAAALRGYSWYQVKVWERNGYFWGFNFSLLQRVKIRLLDSLQNRFRIFKYDEKGFVRFVKKLEKARYIHGYSSMIFETAKRINKKQLTKPKRIKMVKGTSEKIFESYQQEVIKAFGSRIISEYGATESGVIAFECPEGNMHINLEGVIVEEVDNEILVTNLQMQSFPVIRYRLGDYIKLAKKEEFCKCGIQHPILEEVTGRIGANVHGKTNIYPSLYFYYIFKNLSVNHNLKLTYYVEQKTKGELIFYIAEEINAADKRLLVKEINRYFENDVLFTIKKMKEKSLNKSKSQSFNSYI
jgi:phenylacetate-CoA ligase